MHNPAWAVLMYKTLAKREGKKKPTDLFFCVWLLYQKQIKRKNKDRTGNEKKQNKLGLDNQHLRAGEICDLCMCFEYRAQAALMAVRA